MIGNGSAVYTVGTTTAKGMVIGSICTGDSGHICRGDAVAAIQAEVGGIGTGDKVFAIVRVAVVSSAMGVKEHNCAIHHCGSNVGNGSIFVAVLSEGAAHAGGNALALVLILIGEGGVSGLGIVVVGRDQIDLLAGGGAALGGIGLGGGVLSGHILRIHVAGAVTDFGRVTTDDALGGFPGEEGIVFAITDQGALYIGVGSQNQLLDFPGKGCIVLNADGVSTGFNDVFVFEGINHRPDVCFNNVFCFLADRSAGLCRSQNGHVFLRTGCKHGGKQRTDHGKGQEHGQNSLDLLFHSLFSFVVLMR